MARPQKEGMDYFPHDTDAVNDEKIEALRALYGNDGYAFYFILLERIYRTPNFEIDISDAETREETFKILAKKALVTVERFEQIFQTALKWNCFDKDAYEERGVITSKGIKKRAGVVVEKREKMRLRYQEKQEKYENKQEISDAETVEENKRETPQSKEKKSKEKKSIIIMSPEQEKFVNVLKKINHYPLDLEKDIEMFERLVERYPMVDPIAAIEDYALYKLDHPLDKKSNPRSQINTAFQKCVEWRKCLKKNNCDLPDVEDEPKVKVRR
ncbi:DUF4373 domain-containing protein [Thermotalea metallivorans]|uniref:Lin1244/Lin1753-like N-terminal domain-containing protein n=1 Tax=Thermotalea metallivorans TaxID=520762 RepID=A0A140LCI8_9FIRM|nr:DUF4373 domain-containing protein [Thermotalea metallivorans]KXG78263.1 hypothetical protein AN619_02380 [Thermotalea metallivorans]